MDLREIVLNSFDEIAKDGFIEAQVKKTLESTIKETVQDIFRSYSDFGKSLKKHVEEQLAIDLGELDIKQYNELVLAAVKEMLDQAVRVDGIQALKERMDEMFGDVPNEIKLSEIVEKFKSYVIEYDDREDDEITLDVDEPHGYLTFISMDPKSGVSTYQCRYRFHVDREGKLGGARIDGNDIGPRDAMGGLYGFEAFLFKMFAHKTKVILDIDDCDLEYRDTKDEDYD